MFQGALFWMIMGALSVLIGIGAVIWAKDLGFKMNWFKIGHEEGVSQKILQYFYDTCK